MVRGHDEALLFYAEASDGPQLSIEQFHQGQPAGSLRIQQQDGMTVGFDASGHVLFTAQSLPDGGVVVADAHGKQLAAYSADEVERALALTR